MEPNGTEDVSTEVEVEDTDLDLFDPDSDLMEQLGNELNREDSDTDTDEDELSLIHI